MHTCKKHTESKYWKDNIGWIINWLEKTTEKGIRFRYPHRRKENYANCLHIKIFCYFNMFVSISFQGIKWIFPFYSHVLWLFFQAIFSVKRETNNSCVPTKNILFNNENWDKKLDYIDIKYHIFWQVAQQKTDTKNHGKFT